MKETNWAPPSLSQAIDKVRKEMPDEMNGVQRERQSTESNFTIVPNAIIRDGSISITAKTLAIYLLTHEAGYEVKFTQIQRELGLGPKGFRSALKELQEKGLVEARRTKNQSGQWSTYNYHLADLSRVPSGTVEQSTVEQGTVLRIQKEENTKIKNKERELFDEFWNEYPKKVDKAQAFRQFKRALSRARFEDILAGAIRYASDPNLPEARFIKYPATWLNADAWENGPLPERSKSSKPKETDWEALDRWAKEQDERNV
jgi:predicted DNA-binding transcriptional regulator